jgi:ABC-2 type transport system permease protein
MPPSGVDVRQPLQAPLAFATRYAGLFGVQLRMASLAAMQYRVDFLVRGLIAFLWSALTLIPLLVVFGVRKQVAGWPFAEALVVVAWFMLLRSVLEGAVSPSLTAVVEHVRKGTLDFVLLKPADAQFLVSTAKFEPWRIVDAAGALIVFGYAFGLMHRLPSIAHVATGLVFLALAVLILYSIWILVVCTAFWVVKVDNLSYLFGSLFDVGRWPIDVLRGVWRGTLMMVFTFVFPVALMTTYPALALLGRLGLRTAVLALAGGIAFAIIARRVWRRALGMYTSASS